MTKLEEAVIARLKKGMETFEILVDCAKAVNFKKGNDIREVLVAEYIYKDAKKGLHASEHEMIKSFNTDDVYKVAEIIITEGTVQLTKEYRTKLREEKRKRILDLIRMNAVDSKTGLPHPLARIENAMEEARVNIDEFKSPEDQVNDVVEKLRSVLPIKFEIKKYQIRVPAQYAGSSYGIIKRHAKITREDWGNDGSLHVIVEIAPGMTEDFFNQLNKSTSGEVEMKELGENNEQTKHRG